MKRSLFLLLVFINLFSCGKKKADPALLEKIRSEGKELVLAEGFSAPLLAEPNENASPVAEIFFDSVAKGILAKNGNGEDWVHVATTTDQAGWISPKKIKYNANSLVNAYRYHVFADSVKIYAEKDTSSKVLAVRKFGEEGLHYMTDYSQKSDEWLSVQWEEKPGYIKNSPDSLTLYINLYVMYKDKVDIKDFPNPKSKTIGSFKYYDYVWSYRVFEQSESGNAPQYGKDEFIFEFKPFQWLLVNQNGKRGYIPANSVKAFTHMKEYIVTASSVNIRKEPKLNSPVVGNLPNGETFHSWDETSNEDTIDDITANWVAISHNGEKAWIFGGYLREVKDGESDSEENHDHD